MGAAKVCFNETPSLARWVTFGGICGETRPSESAGDGTWLVHTECILLCRRRAGTATMDGIHAAGGYTGKYGKFWSFRFNDVFHIN